MSIPKLFRVTYCDHESGFEVKTPWFEPPKVDETKFIDLNANTAIEIECKDMPYDKEPEKCVHPKH